MYVYVSVLMFEYGMLGGPRHSPNWKNLKYKFMQFRHRVEYKINLVYVKLSASKIHWNNIQSFEKLAKWQLLVIYTRFPYQRNTFAQNLKFIGLSEDFGVICVSRWKPFKSENDDSIYATFESSGNNEI